MDLQEPSSSGWASTPSASAPPIPASPGSPPPAPGSPSVDPTSPWALPAQPPGCQVCGSVPAKKITLRQGIGMLFLRRTKTIRPYVCRDCGIALFRKFQSATLLTGWWGLISFFMNFATLWSNANERRGLNDLGEPHPPSARTAQTPRTTPLAVGRPVFARPQALGAVAAVLVIALLFGLVGRDPSSTSPPAVAVGTCGRIDSGRIHYPVACSDPLASERIVAILPSTDVESDCPASANGASHSDRYGLVCWEAS